MQDIQEIFNQIQEKKKAQKELRAIYKDILANSAEYQESSEQLKTLREKKKQLEREAQKEMGADYDELEKMKTDIASHEVMLADIAMSEVTSGKSLEIVDKYENKYEPIFKVLFRKIK